MTTKSTVALPQWAYKFFVGLLTVLLAISGYFGEQYFSNIAGSITTNETKQQIENASLQNQINELRKDLTQHQLQHSNENHH